MSFFSKTATGSVVLIGGLALCGSGLWLLLSPARYQAMVRVQIGRNDPGVPAPCFIQSEFEIVRSGVVLSNVVEKLNLLENWDGHQYTMGAAIPHLRRCTIVRSGGTFSYMLGIGVVDTEPQTAARIANAVAAAYGDYRIGQIRQQRIRGLKIMKDEYQKEIIDIKAQQDHLETLRKQLKLTNQEGTEATLEAHYPAYAQAERVLTNEEAIHQKRKAIIAALDSSDNRSPAAPSESAIRIVTPAVPPATPIGPNRSLGAVLLICGLGGSTLGGYLILAARTVTKTKP